MKDHYDVIIIGTGAGGGALLQKLAPSGKRILALERGPFLPREKESWDTKIAFNTTRCFRPEAWYDKNGRSSFPALRQAVPASPAAGQSPAP